MNSKNAMLTTVVISCTVTVTPKKHLLYTFSFSKMKLRS